VTLQTCERLGLIAALEGDALDLAEREVSVVGPLVTVVAAIGQGLGRDDGTALTLGSERGVIAALLDFLLLGDTDVELSELGLPDDDALGEGGLGVTVRRDLSLGRVGRRVSGGPSTWLSARSA